MSKGTAQIKKSMNLKSTKFPILFLFMFIALNTSTYLKEREIKNDLRSYEKSVFSQSGEDGVLERIFQIIKPTNHFAVEFGSGDGVYLSNTRNLIINHGWKALLIEGNPDLVKKSKITYSRLPRVKSIHAWVFPGNVELLFNDHGVPFDLDLLCIDIDSNDWYVWRAINEFRPKVVVIEYNPSFPPPQRMVVDFHPMNYWDGSDYYGASIQSLYDLGQKKGYELVHCDSYGANLFFVQKQYFKLFKIKDNNPQKLYCLPKYGHHGRAPNGLGHPAWDLYTVKSGKSNIKPFEKDLIWKNLRIKKRFVKR